MVMTQDQAARTASSTRISYRSLPHKIQLLILLLARFAEPLTTSSIHSYIFFQLRHFNPSASASTISAQSGLIIGCKTAAHVCTGLLWGRLADHVRVGRKSVLVIGLIASALATVGFGFSETFKEAIIWQTLDGALNATIAMVRCMTAELNPEKRYRARALTLLPLSANIGSLLGPLIGGFLVLASAKSDSKIAARYPYAAPNIVVASVQILVALIAMFGLNDTLDRGERLHLHQHPTISQEIDETSSLLPRDQVPSPIDSEPQSPATKTKAPRLPFRKIWTSNVITTMIAHFIIAGHLGTFASLWAIFLSLPTKPLSAQHPPLHFSGGLGLQPYSVGIAMSTFGFAGIVLQIMVYPYLQERFGTIRVWRGALYLFPLVYILAPFCALVASLSKSGTSESNATSRMPILEWFALLTVLILFAAGRTGVVPATSLLINDCTPCASVRGTIHTTGVIVANLSKTIFPPMALAALGYGLKVGVVGLGFWFVAGLAVLSCVTAVRVREGDNGEGRVETSA